MSILAHNKMVYQVSPVQLIGARDRSLLEDILDFKYSFLWDPCATSSFPGDLMCSLGPENPTELGIW